MIALGLRLAVATGREALVRLVVIALAVTLGAGLLLSTIAGVHAVGAQNARWAWLNTGYTQTRGDGDPLWWQLREDYFHRTEIGRLEVAATGPDSPVPPGVPRLPGPGEFYASPALSELLRSTPAAELGDRFPGHQIGTIGDEALPAPDSLLILIGRTPAELSGQDGAVQVTGIMTTDPSDCSNGCYVGINNAGVKLVLSVIAAAMIFPLLVLIGTATRLSAARREQRFAAMRLVGATPRQVSLIAAVESTVAAVAGTVAGFGLYLLIRPVIAGIPFTGFRFFPADLSLTPLDIALVGLGIPVGAALAARFALRRVRISPLGVSRRVTPRPPRVWRLIPLLAGVAEMTYFVNRRPHTTNGQIEAYLSGIFLIMGGLVIAGPWLTMVGSRLLARRATRPATLIAGRRLADNPHAGFRAVSGLMLALFVTSTATGVITTIVANRGAPRTDSVAGSALNKRFDEPPGTPIPVDALRSIPGVRDVLVVHKNPSTDWRTDPDVWEGVVACADLARSPKFGSCPPGAEIVTVPDDLIGPRRNRQTGGTPVWRAAPLTPAAAAAQPVESVVVDTTTTTALERARTVLVNAFPTGPFPATTAEWESNFTSSLVQYRQLANVVILTSLPIAGCSLAVSIAGGLTDRKRPFSMLRLSGVQLGVLRRVVALESAVPLLIVAVLAIGMGFLAAQLFLKSQMRYTLVAPSFSYYLIVAAGLLASLGIIASTLPLLRRITGPETARNE